MVLFFTPQSSHEITTFFSSASFLFSAPSHPLPFTFTSRSQPLPYRCRLPSRGGTSGPCSFLELPPAKPSLGCFGWQIRWCSGRRCDAVSMGLVLVFGSAMVQHGGLDDGFGDEQ
ncbi:hypothetical protein Tsubulata_009560 [Turnera subulata]|uniref:Uncharacterized protein n=1 Tax=Turnera subulata TaxID=218843 RepID=A0A9Q0G0D9_9ROSI|nr:hypothetical protein Tsubulata_009560 [Turnera subulata]